MGNELDDRRRVTDANNRVVGTHATKDGMIDSPLGADGDRAAANDLGRTAGPPDRGEGRPPPEAGAGPADSDRFFQATIDALTSHLAVLDEGGVILAVNEAWRRFADANRFVGTDHGVGSRYLDACVPAAGGGEDVGGIAAGVAAVLGGRAAVFEHEYPCHGPGEERWFVLRVTRFRPPGPVRVVVSHDDVTARKRSERALRESDRRKDEFLATLAHELRNPLAPVRTGVQLLRVGDRDGAGFDRTLAMMDRQLGHMARLIDDLMDVARVSAGKVALRPEPVDLRAVVCAAAEATRPAVAAGGHELVVRQPDGPLPVEADRTRLTQVFTNLLHNAAKYTPPGGLITLTAGRAGAEAVVRVADTGVGIPADMLPRVFDLFAQVPGSLDRSQGGLGIGLTLVKRLVELHGGTVEALSGGPGCGSEFVVRLPLGVGLVAADPPSVADGPPPAATRLGVLVVDDNADAADTLALLLRVQGHEVRTAADGPEALRVLERFRPHLVLLDLGLPGLSGYEVARRVRADPALRGVTLAALTGRGRDEDRRQTAAAGFDHHLVKPVDPDRVTALLAGLAAVGTAGTGAVGPPHATPPVVLLG